MISEEKLVQFFSRTSFSKSSRLLMGIGDDTAVLKTSLHEKLLATTDLLIEGVHFRTDWMSLYQVGRKAMRVNLSDIAAMGGKPLFALISVGIPKKSSLQEVKLLWKGLQSSAREAGVEIIGGDTNVSPQWIVNVVILGETCQGRFLKRSGAQVGDALYVSGILGASRLGLEALLRKKKKGFESFIHHHAEVPDRLKIAQNLVKKRNIHAMMDLSDGFFQGVQTLLKASGVGAEICVDEIPVARQFAAKASLLGLSPTILKLEGGEDYELLICSSSKLPPKVAGVSLTRVGRILPKKLGLILKSQGKKFPMDKLNGFHHF